MTKEKIGKILGIILLAVVLVLLGQMFARMQRPVASVTPGASWTPYDSWAPSESVTPYVEPTPLPSPKIIRNAIWLTEPKKITIDSLFALDYASDVSYYQLGSINGDRIITSSNWDCGIGGCNTYLFRQRGKDFYYLEQDSTIGYQQVMQYGTKFSPGVLYDATSSYVGLRGPSQFTYKGIPFEGSGSPFLRDSNNYPDTAWNYIDEVGAGELFIQQSYYYPSDRGGPIAFDDFYVKLPSGLYTGYSPEYYFRRDDGTFDITFNDATKPTDAYFFGMNRGCGGYGSATITQPDASRIHISGHTSKGEPIYEFSNVNDPILRIYYENMPDNNDDGVREYYDAERGSVPITIQEFAGVHAILLYKDSMNRWLVISNSKYGPQAECGKPVIYLYPIKPTQVSVKVGANITVSDPEYGNGWNVLAEPTGKQTLFWEGTGFGRYPEVTSGFVVKHENIETALRSQLAQQGLNARESQDFLDFWLPKMPTTPYIRLTWFGTKEMNELAPLYVSPKPDSVIRVFLDFQGLQKPISIPEQKLSSVARTGFTLAEWGGLLKK